MYKIKDRKFIGRKIKEKREELSLSQERLAEAIGVTYQQLQRYEYGKGHVNTDRLQAISNALDVPITYFFEEPGEKKIKIMDRGLPYISPEEKEFIEYLRKIDNDEYKKGIFLFLVPSIGSRKR